MQIYPTIREFSITATYTLIQAKVDSPQLSAQLCIAHALNMPKLQLIIDSERPLLPEEQKKAQTLVNRRAKGEPLAYILGYKEFYSNNFLVNSATLIPRPETEHLVEFALNHFTQEKILFADIGTGSGCIAISLCLERPGWNGCMLDISAQALNMAKINAKIHKVEQQLLAIRANMEDISLKNNCLDLIVSNPPYLSESDYNKLSKEIQKYEPRNALQPSDKGLNNTYELEGLRAFYILAEKAGDALKHEGIIIVEHGYSQGKIVKEIFENHAHWYKVKICKDLAGKDRYCVAHKALK